MSERIALQERQWELAGFRAGEGQAQIAGDEGWFGVPFPATIRDAHAAVGRPLPDAWRSMEWWYRCRFARPGGKDRVVRLAVEGVDFRSVVHLNGEALGENRGAFGPATFDISNVLSDENLLAICVKPLANDADRLLTPSRHPLRWETPGEMHYEDYGVWDGVNIAVSGPVYFDGWLVHGTVDGEDGDLIVRLDINNTRSVTTTAVRLRVEGEGIEPVEETFEVELATGLSQQEFNLTVPKARAWYPHTLGSPVLYKLEAELALGGGKVDAFQSHVAFRSFRVNRGGDWQVKVNGAPMPVRGVNWAALPLPPGQSLSAIVDELVAAGVNAIRVWGGRHREEFYTACDTRGVLVVQEFPFGLMDGKTYPRQTPDFPSAREIPIIARADNNAMARHLRNHPSIALWVGGTRIHNQDNAHVMRTIEEALRIEDGTRPYLAVLPNAGCRLDWDILQAGMSPEHFEDGPPLLVAGGLPSWDPAQEPPEGLPARWRKYGGVSAQARSFAWAAGGQRYHETAGGFIGEVRDWSHDGGYGLFDFAGKKKLGLEVLRGLYAPVAAALSFDWKAYRGGAFSAEVWAVRDDGAGEAAARVWIEDRAGVEIGAAQAKGALENGRGMLGEVDFTLTGSGPFTARVQAEGGHAVPYPLDAPKPPSSYSLAEISQTRFRLAVQTQRPRFLRDFGIYALLPVEGLLRVMFALRVALGV